VPKLSWDAVGERFYETGIDRGVLFVDTNPGVAWTGLISVSESPSGGDPKPYYIDGIKYLNLSTAEEFEATIAAFNRPSAFGVCEGVKPIQNGLFVTNQPKKSFGLSYRSKVGNDIQGSDHAYKIHLVYNALAGSSARNHNTVTESVDPAAFSWSITTLPPTITGYKRTAHLIIDSRYTEADTLSDVEDIIYGNASTSARLPTPNELIGIFSS
jgi:hypothetical protein